jgi:hypothetical protein
VYCAGERHGGAEIVQGGPGFYRDKKRRRDVAYSDSGRSSYRFQIGKGPSAAIYDEPLLFSKIAQNSRHGFPRTSNKLADLLVGQGDANS